MSYIVFEGPDFAGKSTLTKKVAERLGYRLVAEPFTESENAKAVKNAIINNTFNKETEIFLLAANRLEAFRDVITPNRHSPGVIGDRSVVSTMVYQVGEGVYNRPLNILNFMAQTLQDQWHDIYPDHLFFLDIDHDTYLERLAVSDRVADEKEKALMDPGNWMKLKEDYLTAIQWITFSNPDVKVHFITPETTVDEIVAIIDPSLIPE
ncbi:thymidylate kinase [Erwinia phage AH04]|uniref:dTMP kinase n=1 Tax=Erwinia phage AH04 TaxID=2869569 RepID=A0AAE8BQT1_9CAUD|nr:thymidylate kinase [Erwinia phage AH04]QZA70500.1 thymidylate kinase [Erwinia phage AH04]